MLDGFGGMGEGMSVQIAPDGRRIIWLAHESAPKNFTAVDVSDPRKPKVICQTDLPNSHMRSNSLETCGNIMAVAYQTQKKGLQPAGMELFDISNAGEAALDLVLRLLGRAFARRAPALVLRRRIRPHGVELGGLRADASAGRPVLPLHRRAQPVEADRSRPLAHAGHQAGRQRAAAAAPSARQGLPRAQLQRLSAAPGPLLPRLYRRRHARARHLGQGATRSASRPGPTRRPTPASCTRWCRCSTAA